MTDHVVDVFVLDTIDMGGDAIEETSINSVVGYAAELC